MNHHNLPNNNLFKPFFVLKAHTYKKTLHGRLFEFEHPLFTTDLLSSGKEIGLFISVKDGTDLDAYIFIDQRTLLVMMDEETDRLTSIPPEQIIAFAERNKSMMTKLALDLNSVSKRQQSDEFVPQMEQVETTLPTGRTVRVYRFPTVEYENSLRLKR